LAPVEGGARMEAGEFRRLMSLFATGVTVVTTADGGRVHGMTANAFCSLSLNPPLVLVCVDQAADTRALIEQNGAFGINILRADQLLLAKHLFLDKKLKAKFWDLVKYRWLDETLPVLEDCLAYIGCKLWASYPGGDHTIYVGRVVAHRVFGGVPLVFWNGCFWVPGRQVGLELADGVAI